MNIEEHIKNLKKYIEEDFAFREPIKNMSDFDKYCWNHCKDIETLLTAYEKEKETNKQIKSKLDEKNIPIETLLAEFERLEDLEDDLTTVYLNGVYDGEKKVQDKIKARIKELEEYLYKGNIKDDFLMIRIKAKIQELQSLLDKE